MKIIFITYHDDRLCGCDTFITELSQPLSETDGANVSVVTFGYPHPQIKIVYDRAVRQIFIPALGIDRWLKSIALMATVIPDSADTIFLLGFTPSAEIAGWIKRIFLHSRFIHLIHDFMWAIYVNGDIDRFKEIIANKEQTPVDFAGIYNDGVKTFELADAVVCLSEDTRQLLHSFYNLPKGKVHLIKNGLRDGAACHTLPIAAQAELRNRFGIRPDSFVFLYVGRLSEQKGFGLLLDSLDILAEQTDLDFTVVCAGEIYPSYLQDSIPHIRSRRLILTGMLDRGSLYDLYSITDCGLILSKYEQCSYVGIEMKMFSLPIISTQNYGIRNMFDSQCSIPVGNNAMDVSCAMLRVMDLSNVRDELRDNSRKSYEEAYTASFMTSNYLRLFNQLVVAN